MNVAKFILFAHPRSGSTMLANILNQHPGLSVLVEPFQEKFPLWSPDHPKYLDRIVDAKSLDAQLIEIFATYDGIKEINWPLDSELYAHMLADERWRVVFLRRQNLLKASLSCAICTRTGVWQKGKLPADPKPLYEALNEIPVSEVINWVEAVGEEMDRFDSILDSRAPDTVKRITYEDLYDDSPSQERTLYEIFDFLGVRRVLSQPMRDLLDPSRNQMHPEDMYRYVPNLNEIAQAALSTGRLDHGKNRERRRGSSRAAVRHHGEIHRSRLFAFVSS